MQTQQLCSLTVEVRRKQARKKFDELNFLMVNDDTVAREELKKFFVVGAVRHKEGEYTGMPACYLDTFWHRLLKEQPEEYERICSESVNELVDHISYNGEGPWEWVSCYETMFGSLSPIWFTDPDGIFNGPMYVEYMETGVVKASWNCSPGFPMYEEKLESRCS